MTSSPINSRRRHLIQLLPFAVASAAIGPRALFASSFSLPPDIHLLDDFPGAVGSYDWTSFAFKVVPIRKTKENPEGIPSLQVGEEWVNRITVSIPKTIERHNFFYIKASFDDSNIPEGYWCSGLIVILESELCVIDSRDRYFRTKAHQVVLHARFTSSVAPYISTRVKLASPHSRIGVVACVETPGRGILNVPRDIKVPEAYVGLCGWGGIYAASTEEMKRLKRE